MSRMDPTDGTLRRWTGLALVGLVVLGSMVGGAAAHTDTDEHGTLTFHDEEGSAPASNDSSTIELECQFWIRGEDMSHEEGVIRSAHDPGPGPHSHRVTVFEANGNASDGSSFEEGPFTLHNGGDDWQIWAAAEGEHSTRTYNLTYTPCEGEDEEGREDSFEARPTPSAPACPENVQAQARGDEAVNLTWNASADATSYHVYRASEDSRLEHVAEVNNTTYRDEATKAGNTYRYQVTAAQGTSESEHCATVQVTAIPFFADSALLVLAGTGALATIAALRRHA